MNLQQTITNQLDDNSLGLLGAAIGVREVQLRDGVSVAIPAILNSIGSVAQTEAGAQSLWLELRDTDSSLNKSFPTQLHYRNSEILIEHGNQQLLGLIGPQAQPLILDVSRKADIGSTATRKLVGVVTPLILATLAKQQHENNLNAKELQVLLAKQQQHIATELIGKPDQLAGQAPFSSATGIAADSHFGAKSQESRYDVETTTNQSSFSAASSSLDRKPKHEFDYSPKRTPEEESVRSGLAKRVTATGTASISLATLAAAGLAAGTKQADHTKIKGNQGNDHPEKEDSQYDLRVQERRNRKAFAANPSAVSYAIDPNSEIYKRLCQPKTGDQSRGFKHNPIAGFSTGSSSQESVASDAGATPKRNPYFKPYSWADDSEASETSEQTDSTQEKPSDSADHSTADSPSSSSGAPASSGAVKDEAATQPRETSDNSDFNLTSPSKGQTGFRSSSSNVGQDGDRNNLSGSDLSGASESLVSASDSGSDGNVDSPTNGQTPPTMAGFATSSESAQSDSTRTQNSDNRSETSSGSLSDNDPNNSPSVSDNRQYTHSADAMAGSVANSASLAQVSTSNDGRSRADVSTTLDSEIPQGRTSATKVVEPGFSWLLWPVTVLGFLFGLIAVMKMLTAPAPEPISKTTPVVVSDKADVSATKSNLAPNTNDQSGTAPEVASISDDEAADELATETSDEKTQLDTPQTPATLEAEETQNKEASNAATKVGSGPAEYRKATGDVKANLLIDKLKELNEEVTSTFSAKKKLPDFNSEITRLENLNDMHSTWSKKAQTRYVRKLRSTLANFEDTFGSKLEDDRIKSVLGDTFSRLKSVLEAGSDPE